MGKTRKPFYTVLDIPNAERLVDYYNNIIKFKTEEDAYKGLLQDNFTSSKNNDRSLQILLLVSELSKIDADIAYKMFLTEDKHIKIFNHVTVMGYLNRNKMFKIAFKAYCDMVAVMGLGYHKDKRVCFEHYEVEEHPAGTDITKI